jgi:shikimate 5-dehydrogenase
MAGRTFAILGTGGTARAALHAVRRGGGKPIVFGRTPEKVRELAGRWGCPGYALAALAAVRADVVINTTPVGMGLRADETPLDARLLRECPAEWVVDVIYRPLRTRLLREAEAAGRRTLGGVEMFVRQGAEQFRLWTGAAPPVSLMREVVLKKLQEEEASTS